MHESGKSIPNGESYEPMEPEIMPPEITAITGESPVAMFGYAPSVQARIDAQERQAEEARRVESLKILDKDAFKLGDLNPLVHATDLNRKESVDAVSHTILQKIHEYGGMEPTVLESAYVVDVPAKQSGRRFIARFEVPSLPTSKIEMLEELVKQTYGMSVRTRTDSKGNKIPAEDYPPTQPGEEMEAKTAGWYMGSAPFPTSPLYPGLFVFKDWGIVDPDNFSDDSMKPLRYIVEVREAGQYQTDLVTFVTQVATVLANEELPDRGQLLYETYYDLIRLGLKKADERSVYGMEEAADMIRRELIIPLASPDISKGVDEEPQSVLMVGVPGTGKTLLVERLLHEDTGLFVLPIDPFELQKELALPKEKQYLLPRIGEIARITGKKVVLHVDDIENMVGEQEVTNSTMLNLMAGVQESGFYIIASTNYPKKVNPSLIQPQRFSVLIHCGLQDIKARYEILKIHAAAESDRLKMPLFANEKVRDIILQEVAERTEAFTPRYLANIATIAKSHLVNRVAKDKQRTIGLTEQDLAGYTFTVEDWDRAYAEVASKYDSDEVKRRDEEIARFVKKQKVRKGLGFAATSGTVQKSFSDEVYAKVAAAEQNKQ